LRGFIQHPSPRFDDRPVRPCEELPLDLHAHERRDVRPLAGGREADVAQCQRGPHLLDRAAVRGGNSTANPALAVSSKKGIAMAVNKPVGDNARKGAVRKRSQLKTKIAGEAHWTKRSKSSGQFMDQKKSASAKPFKGVRKEKAG
jgi:hypothetical protein